MLSNVLVVAEQVAVLFILIALGFVSGKSGLINESGAKYLTNVVLYLATPCVMINSFQKVGYSPELILNLGICALCAVMIQGLSIFVSRAIFRNKDEERRVVLRFAVVFSNCGFMSLPLQQALLGDKGVFYGSVFVAVFNILVWSYGLVDMSGDKENFTVKKLILNPGILGAFGAALLFFLQIHLPEILLSPIQYIAALNTPIPMLVIGFHLTRFSVKKSIGDLGIYAAVLVRLIAIPICALLIMKLFGVSGDILAACTVAASAPVAATTTMFATKFNRNVDLSVGLVSISTILSIITMPVIIALSQTLG
ncbi:MAG: AEC family transporter [Ruminococcus sp.]|nr:AEC family transporter [Ruminococcus sp.]